MSRQVYLVTHGDYSDYSVDAAFSTKAVADAVLKRLAKDHERWGDYRVEEMTVYDEDPPRVLIYCAEWDGRRNPNAEPRRWTNLREGWDAAPPFVGKVVRGLGVGKYEQRFYRFWGTDEARVNKAFNDHHAQMQAELQGVA